MNKVKARGCVLFIRFLTDPLFPADLEISSEIGSSLGSTVELTEKL